MCVCMYVCVCVCVCECMLSEIGWWYMAGEISGQVCVCIFMYVCMYVCTNVYIWKFCES